LVIDERHLAEEVTTSEFRKDNFVVVRSPGDLDPPTGDNEKTEAG
jgi:hypothetical protein